MIANLTVAVLVGLGTGLATWWLTARGATPKIVLSDEISKLPDESGAAAWRYRFKMLNKRRLWLRHSPAVELDVAAVLRVRGLRPSTPGSWFAFRIPTLMTEEIPYMRDNRAIRLRLHEIDFDQLGLLPGEVRAAIRDGSITLESLFTLGEEAALHVIVSASHGYTHARTTELKRYRASAIRCGKFEPLGVAVVPDPSLCSSEGDDENERASAPTSEPDSSTHDRLAGSGGLTMRHLPEP